LSSILKALKRIEKAAPRQDDSIGWPRQIDDKKAVKSRAKKTWFFNRLLSLLVIIIIFLIAGWLVLDNKNLIIAKLFPQRTIDRPQQAPQTSKKKSSVHQAKIDRSSAIPKKKPLSTSQLSKSSTRKTVSEKDPLRTTPNSPAVKLPSSASPQKPQKSSKIPPSQKDVRPSEMKIRAQTSRPETITTPPKSGTKSVSRASAQGNKIPATRQNVSTIQRMMDDKLKLQAIAWSADAGRRMAVINNHIVREGESIEGFSVTQIRQEDVIVDDGSQPWRLEFGLKH
jgi:hypothetical protein